MKKYVKSFGLICAYTSRSKAYIQSLRNSGFTPEFIVLYGAEGVGRPGQMKDYGEFLESEENIGNIFIPNLKISIEDSLKDYGWRYIKVNDPSVNSQHLLDIVKLKNVDYIVFSGYGGEIVSPEMLSHGSFLHSHSGWLPDYRGSTCGYYSLINEGFLGASVIILNNKIDEGVIIKRKKYSFPFNKLALDHLYDSAIRADILVLALKKILTRKKIEQLKNLDYSGKTYYVIHPLLKHLAILYERS